MAYKGTAEQRRAAIQKGLGDAAERKTNLPPISEAERAEALMRNIEEAQQALFYARIAAEDNKPIEVAENAEIAMWRVRVALGWIGGTS